MKSVFRFAFAGALVLALGQAFAGPFTAGNIVVLRVGDGSAALTTAATPIYLEEYTPGGTLVQTIAAPTSTVGSNRQITATGTSGSSPMLTRSVDGNYLTFGGYDSAVGTPAVSGLTSAVANRVVAIVSANGTLDTTTALTDAFSTNSFRGVVTTNGTDLWLSGTGATGTAGVRYATKGGTTSILVNTGVTNCRGVNIYNGQLYVSTMSGAFRGINTVGTGLPTTTGNATTLLAGFDPSTTSPLDTYDFYFSDANTLYITDARALPSGGVQKWTFDGSLWSLAYTLNAGLDKGCLRLAGQTVGGVTTIYAVTGSNSEANPNKLAVVTDTGALSSFTVLANAGTNQVFHGVALAPGQAAQTVAVGAITLIEGESPDGGLAEVAASDDAYYTAFNDSSSLACKIQFDGTTTILTPSQVKFDIEYNVARGGLAYNVALYRFSTGTFVSQNGGVGSTSDQSVSVTISTNAANYVGGAGELSAQIRFNPINDEAPAFDGWQHAIDFAQWTVTP
ncbi:MAG: hypothetical protein U0S12_01480 [Fimbriimonadales bacterium]